MKLITLRNNKSVTTTPDVSGVCFFGFDAFTRAFVSRVHTDGGVVESAGCIRKRITKLMQ